MVRSVRPLLFICTKSSVISAKEYERSLPFWLHHFGGRRKGSQESHDRVCHRQSTRHRVRYIRQVRGAISPLGLTVSNVMI
jgi:hypothetical protein